MQPTVTGGVAWSVRWSVTIVSRAKMAEPIEMPFGLWTRVGKRKHALDGGPNYPIQMGNFKGEGAAHCKG